MAKLLVVDDEASMVETLADCLSARGHDVVACVDSARAEELALSEKPDVLIVDFQMPGKTGAEVLAGLRSRPETKGLPVIFLSGTETLRYSSQVPAEPIVRFLRKPMEMEELLTLIAELLDPEGWSRSAR